MLEPRTFSIIEADQRWSASYLVDDKGLCVMSAYGGDRVPLGRKVDPEVKAKEVFKVIVRKRLASADPYDATTP